MSEQKDQPVSDAGPPHPPPWVPLLRRLTEISPTWGVWKNADRAIAVSGDIDSVSVPAARDILLDEFFGWASANAMGPFFKCHHLPGSVLGVALRERRDLVELQLCERAIFRGSTLFTARQLVSLMTMDARGFRRLRSGSEGLLLLFHNAMKHGGRPSLEGEKAVRLLELMRQDPDGVEAATEIFGPVRGDARGVAARALEGGWDRTSALRIEGWALSRGLRDLRLLTARAAYRARGQGYCPLLPVLRRGRRVDGDVDAWLERAVRAHTTRRPPLSCIAN
jgi:hypothetical protein